MTGKKGPPKHIEELPAFLAKLGGLQDKLAPRSSVLTNLAVGVTSNGFVHVALGEPMDSLALQPDQAEQIAELLQHYAKEARKIDKP